MDEVSRPTASSPVPGRGSYVVIAGPDGAGKSTVVDALVGEVLTGEVLRLHHRPRVLGGLTEHDGAPVTEPHRQEPYPRLLSTAKLLYLYLDFLLGWVIRVRPWLRAGGDVVLERGWWDLLVDPRRYRLRSSPRLMRLLGTLLPRPDVTLVLDGDAAVIAARKSELSAQETGRQLEAWRRVPRRAARAHQLDVCRPLDQVQRDACRAVAGAGTGRWIGLPGPTAPRWVLPTSPSPVAVAALGIYNPVTTRGRLGWQASRHVARVGGLRLLRTHLLDPPADVLEVVGPHVPSGATVAVARGNHPARSTALLLDRRSGRPVAFAKVALDEAGPAALAAEADNQARFVPLLPDGLTSPRLLAHDPHLLLFDPVVPVPQRRPWVLPVGAAALLGRFHHNGRTAALGPCHGDCAPWNLLWTTSGWYLVDWADARDDAPPFEDLFHHLVQTHALLGRPSRSAILDGIEGRGPIGHLLRAYARAAEVEEASAGPLFERYLRRSAATLTDARADGRAGLEARTALLRARQERPAHSKEGSR